MTTAESLLEERALRRARLLAQLDRPHALTRLRRRHRAASVAALIASRRKP